MTQPDQSERDAYTLEQMAAFLDGSASIDGLWFGDRHPTERGAFWWRKHLRKAIEMRQPTQPPEGFGPWVRAKVVGCEQHIEMVGTLPTPSHASIVETAEKLQQDKVLLQKPTQPHAGDVEPFNKEAVVSKALSMFGMIDTEQMMRTVKAMRELNMSPYDKPAASVWMPISSAPVNESVLVWIPNAEHYGEPVYRGLQVEMGTGRRWQVSGLHMGRDCGPHNEPTMWQPLPSAPTEKL